MTIPSTVEVFLIAGQSNATGTATNAPKRAALLSPEGFIYTGSIGNLVDPAPVQNEVVRLCYGITNEAHVSALGHGIELNLCFQYNAYFGKPCIVMKETQGGTNLHTDWASGSALRNSLISRANALTTYLTSIGRTWSIAGFYWNQWEGDISQSTAAYKANLESLASNLRSNITGFSTSVPFVACRPSTKIVDYGSITNVRTAIETASITNYSYLDQDDLFYIQPDSAPIHCNSYSQNLLAQRFLTVIYPSITFI